MYVVSIALAQVFEYWLRAQPLWKVLDGELGERNHRTGRQMEIVKWNDGEGHGAASPANNRDHANFRDVVRAYCVIAPQPLEAPVSDGF
jgi:hypothetical protein